MFDVPAPIKDYINEVKDQLNMLTEWPDSALPAAEKITFFKETRHTFGRTALLLSGGGGLGCFHVVSSTPPTACSLGAWLAAWEQQSSVRSHAHVVQLQLQLQQQSTAVQLPRRHHHA